MNIKSSVQPSFDDLEEILSRKHLPSLDGLRALSVFLVIIYHAGFNNVPGDLGVSGFFVLSGFLITTLLIKELDSKGSISLKDFYLRRTLRIFPAYYCFIIVSYFVDGYLGDPWSTGMILSAFGYAMNYYNAFMGHPINSIAHAWSLGIEEQFYFIWPILLIILSRKGEQWMRKGLALIILIVLSWRSVLFLIINVSESYVYNAFDSRFDNLAVGCLLAVLLRSRSARQLALKTVWRPWFPFITLFALFVSRTQLGLSYHYSIGFTVDAVLVAVFIVQVLQLHQHYYWSWLNNSIVRFFGLISYPLYLWHIWGFGLGRFLLPSSTRFQMIIGLISCIILASGSYYIIELPFLRLKRRFSPKLSG